MGTLVSYELDNSIATITMDDGRVNVLSPQMLSELNVALADHRRCHERRFPFARL